MRSPPSHLPRSPNALSGTRWLCAGSSPLRGRWPKPSSGMRAGFTPGAWARSRSLAPLRGTRQARSRTAHCHHRSTGSPGCSTRPSRGSRATPRQHSLLLTEHDDPSCEPGSRVTLAPFDDLLRELEEPGCVACRRGAWSEDRFVSGFVHEAYSNAGLRDWLRRSLGFCPAHTRRFLGMRESAWVMDGVYAAPGGPAPPDLCGGRAARAGSSRAPISLDVQNSCSSLRGPNHARGLGAPGPRSTRSS